MCKVLIADNELALAFELEKYLTECGYQVVGPAVSGRQAISMTENLRPDLALINTKLAGEMDGLDAAEHIKRALKVPVVIVSWYQDKGSLHHAVKINSEGYVVKPFHFAQVHASIEVALEKANGQGTMESETAKAEPIISNTASAKGLHYSEPLLTPTEVRIARLIKAGMGTQKISEILEISAQTVAWHRKNIRKKIGVTGSRTRNLMGNLAALGPLQGLVQNR